MNRNFKSILAALMAICMLGTMAACGDSDDGNERKKRKSSSESEVVEKGVDFNKIFKECELSSDYAEVASDGSYLSIDTDPKDLGGDAIVEDILEACAAYERVNAALGLPESLEKKMSETNALDGRQSQTYDNITVSWKYHPDHGLEITYELK